MEADPRPLPGEPLPLDVLNTQWLDDDGPVDQLADLAGATLWLEFLRQDAASGVARVAPPDLELLPRTMTEATRATLVRARAAIRAVAEDHTSGAALDELNAILARGRRERRLSPDGAVQRATVDEQGWALAWLAADGYVDLVQHAPQRIRRCDHPDCVLWYLDTSRSGTRRWCSMSGCGNRAKAQRHYRRRTDAP